MKIGQITAEDRRLLYRILLDLFILVVLFTTIYVCHNYVKPSHRGFFCSDESIRYPFHNNTVSKLMLVLIGYALSAVVMIVVEFMRFWCCDRRNKSRLLFGLNIPIWIVEFLKYYSFFVFGLFLTLVATDVGKYTIGRLRPHFMSVCQPLLVDGSTCDDPQNRHRYIENYTCAGIGYLAKDLRNVNLSFPSGHSSSTFYTTVFLVIYLQYKFTWRCSRFLRYCLQFSLAMLAWFVALSRIMDNYHHWSDVLCGSLLGTAIAVGTALLIISDLRKPLLNRLHSISAPQDIPTTLKSVITISPASYEIDEAAS